MKGVFFFVFVIVLLFVSPAFADFSGRVVGVSDGDTIKVLPGQPSPEPRAERGRPRVVVKDESLGKLEAEARGTRRGLWADRDPSRPGAGGSGRRGGSAEG